MRSNAVQIHIGGAARGNPGPAAYAFVITRDGKVIDEQKGCLGEKTNNVAEYTALIRALERAAQLGERQLVIHSDSELLVKQMKGVYRVKNVDLQALYSDAKELCKHFDAVTIHHVRREQNSHADRLCNEALDGAGGAKTVRAPRRVSKDLENMARQEAVTCLRNAATAWAGGNPRHPSAEAVWDQLWSILEENGLVRSAPRGKE